MLVIKCLNLLNATDFDILCRTSRISYINHIFYCINSTSYEAILRIIGMSYVGRAINSRCTHLLLLGLFAIQRMSFIFF